MCIVCMLWVLENRTSVMRACACVLLCAAPAPAHMHVYSTRDVFDSVY